MKIDKLTVHCADTPNYKHFTVEDIDRWHKQRGFSKIGYHWVIYVDGSLHKGREEDELGAHVKGHNTGNIGVCLIGKDKFTGKQIETLVQLIIDYELRFPEIKIYGHYQFDSKKTCPNINIPKLKRKYNL